MPMHKSAGTRGRFQKVFTLLEKRIPKAGYAESRISDPHRRPFVTFYSDGAQLFAMPHPITPRFSSRFEKTCPTLLHQQKYTGGNDILDESWIQAYSLSSHPQANRQSAEMTMDSLRLFHLGYARRSCNIVLTGSHVGMPKWSIEMSMEPRRPYYIYDFGDEIVVISKNDPLPRHLFERGQK
jgi:hypothetical protein